jgi:F0F1-type ATP synthase membrane subunit b/b'
MADTIEAFVAKIQSEGVQAGKAEGEKVVADARRQAEQIVEHAKAEGERIVQNARAEAQGILQRSRTDLKLAARDTILKLRDTLTRCLERVLGQGAEEALGDANYVAEILKELVRMYAAADIEHRGRMGITVPPQMHHQLAEWALGRLRREAAEANGQHVHIDLRSTLQQAGFEYAVSGATIEVTTDSVVAALKPMVGPALAETLEQAAKDIAD